jgi:membrane protease YdiL (CAAX protease family)
MIGLRLSASPSQIISLLIFLVVSAAGTLLDLQAGGIQGILDYHKLSMLLIILSSLQPAISEELVLRGVIFGKLQRHFSPWFPLHLDPVKHYSLTARRN